MQNSRTWLKLYCFPQKSVRCKTTSGFKKWQVKFRTSNLHKCCHGQTDTHCHCYSLVVDLFLAVRWRCSRSGCCSACPLQHGNRITQLVRVKRRVNKVSVALNVRQRLPDNVRLGEEALISRQHEQLRLCCDRQTDRQWCHSHTTRHSTRKPARTALTVLWQTDSITTTHTHTHPFNGPLSGTTGVSRYQKGKTTLDFTEARDSEWQWHQLGHMQVCTSLQTDNHTSTPLLRIQTAYNNRIQDTRNLSDVSGTVQLCDSTNDVCCPCDRA